jgi:hypothetical protein
MTPDLLMSAAVSLIVLAIGEAEQPEISGSLVGSR